MKKNLNIKCNNGENKTQKSPTMKTVCLEPHSKLQSRCVLKDDLRMFRYFLLALALFLGFCTHFAIFISLFFGISIKVGWWNVVESEIL